MRFLTVQLLVLWAQSVNGGSTLTLSLSSVLG